MANVISKLFIKTFEDNVRHLAQQTEARLRPWVQEKAPGGSTHNWGRMAAQSMSAKSTRQVATPTNDSVWSNRISTIATYHGGDSSEAEDINQLLIDPNSTIARSLAAAARRQVDDIIIAAATGTALDETGANNAVPAGQIAGDYTGEIDFATVTLINQMFLDKDVPADEPKVFVVGTKQARKLLHEAKATDVHYVEAKQLVSGGFIKDWMGFTWVVSTRLLKPQAGQITCFAMTRQALGLQVNYDIRAKVAEDPSISFATRIYTALSMGAVRVEDEQLVEFQCKDTTTLT